VQGGKPTLLNEAYVLRGGDRVVITHPHVPTQTGNRGRILVTLCGAVLEEWPGLGRRDPEAVEDMKNDLVSLKMP
jgi:hypothetical protein